jgi:hypothetical protein
MIYQLRQCILNNQIHLSDIAKEEQKEQKEEETFKCEITNKPKRPSTVDCNCEYGCMAKMSETFIIHYEGGVGIISKK